MLTTPKAIIFCAPAAWGKTRNAKALQQEFGCTRVIDEWHARRQIKPGALHLTNMHPNELRSRFSDKATIVARGW